MHSPPHSYKRLAAAGCLILASLMFARAASADEHGVAAPGAARIPLGFAIDRALVAGPELPPARASSRGAAELTRSARAPLSSPPTLELSVGPRFGSARGLDASAGLWQELPLAGVGKARGRVGRARQQAARHELKQAEISATLAAALAWVGARSSRERVRLRSASLAQARDLDRLSRSRAKVGAITDGELAMSTAALGTAKAAVLAAQGDQFAADAELTYQLGLEPHRSFEAVGPLDQDGPEVTEANALAEARVHPNARRMFSEASAMMFAAEQVRAEGAPRLAVGPVVTREATGDWIILGRMSVPLPLVDPARFESAERRRIAAIVRAQAAREAARHVASAGILWHERKHARRTRDALQRGALAPAQKALSQVMLQFGEGKVDLSVVLNAGRAQIETQERWLEAATDARAAEFKLFSAMGRLPDGRSL